MIPVFSTNEVRKLDSFAIEKLKVPSIVLMENAALNMKTILDAYIKKWSIHSIGIICGRGNNGGDGYCLARHLLNSGYRVTILSLFAEKELSPDAQINYHILKNISRANPNLKLVHYRKKSDLLQLKRMDLIIDAILGSGATGKLKDPILAVVTELNKFQVKKVAVDIPTGLDANTGSGEIIFNAEVTITLGALKKGLFIREGAKHAGEIHLAEIGIKPDFAAGTNHYLIEPEDAYLALPNRNRDINKYSSGKVLSIAGSFHLPGAALLCTESVFKVGAGASVLAVPDPLGVMFHSAGAKHLVIDKYSDDDREYLTENAIRQLKNRIVWADAIVIGPGLGTQPETKNAVKTFLRNHRAENLLIDADALNAISGTDLKQYHLKNNVLTPHPGEFAKLLGITVSELHKDIFSYAQKFAVKYKCHLLLKDFIMIYANPAGEIFINSTGNNGLAKFGSGDVLSGMLAGFFAQNNNMEDSVIAAMCIQGLAADILAKKMSMYGYNAEDLINALPQAIQFLRSTFERLD